MAPNPNYHSYLLRLWRNDRNEPWRASLQSAATGEKRVFVDLLTLLAFLLEEVGIDEDAGELAPLAAWLQAQIASAGSQAETDF